MLLPELRQQVFRYAKQMADDKLAHGSQGNISVIDRASGLIAITPSAMDYVSMTVDDTVVIDASGSVVEGRWKPTVETPLHTLLYRRREDVGCVVHCHAPHVSGFAAAMRPIPMMLAEAACCIGHEVPVAPFMPSGTAEFAELMLEVIGDGSAAIAGQHGLVVCGVNARRAYGTTIAVEDSARAYLLARQMGFEPTAIPPDTCKALHDWWLANYEQTSARPLAS
jgi:ribulose-5-phosphate 4-epimerase/fuculose-1-phosphate aldolase